MNWTFPFVFEGLLGSKFRFNSNFKSTFQQIVKCLYVYDKFKGLVLGCIYGLCVLSGMSIVMLRQTKLVDLFILGMFHGRIQRGVDKGPDSPEKSQKYKGFFAILVRIP